LPRPNRSRPLPRPPTSAPRQFVNWLICRYRVLSRALAWIGALAIVILSVVPAVDRPITGAGQSFEHFTAFALVAGTFAIGYRLSLIRLLLLAVLFCGFVELLQVPLPTRHARVSDFSIDLVGSWVAIGFVVASEYLSGVRDSPLR
jgi:hypothetical protein